MNVVSLFAGIGGFDLGLERAGFRVVAQVELDGFCQRVLERRFPDAAQFEDVRRTNFPSGLEIDLLVGGFPCQDLSVAGKRAGLAGERSGLFWEIVRIGKALRPRFGLFENVPGLLSSQGGADFYEVLQGLREVWPVVGYRILDSQHFGVAQRRRRVFLVGGPTEASVAEVLALTEGGGEDSAAGREAGARVAGGAVASTLNSGGNDGGFRAEPGEHLVIAFDPTTSLDQAPNDRTAPPLNVGSGLASMPWSPAVAINLRGREEGARPELSDKASLRAASGGSSRSYVQTTHALTGEGHDASEDGTGRGTPLVAFQNTGQGWWNQRDTAQAIRTPAGSGSLEANLVASQSAILRRLTPLECERLQGFPDGFTCLCTPLDAYAADPDGAALACRCPDSPRYRALGNAVTVNVIEWLGRRLMEVMR